jgi:hypothetical protein
MAQFAIWIIRLYQRTISPDHSAWGKRRYPHGYCRFYPSCSEYGRITLLKNGMIIGSCRMLWRVLRCNPWNPGGTDEP